MIQGKGDIGGEFLSDARRAWGDVFEMACLPEQHKEEARQSDKTVVLAFDAKELGLYTSNDFVSEYVKTDPSRLIGFCSVDPKRPDACSELMRSYHELDLKGLKLGPIYQMFDPSDKICYPLYSKAEELNMPILWHMATSFPRSGPLDYCNPVLLDPIARSFPRLKMVIAHLGHPWHAEAACVIRKQPNVYCDMSALWMRPWQFYNAMVNIVEYRVTHKVIFGTDFPFGHVQETIDAFRDINKIVEGTNLPRIPEQDIEDIIHRNSLELLGIG